MYFTRQETDIESEVSWKYCNLRRWCQNTCDNYIVFICIVKKEQQKKWNELCVLELFFTVKHKNDQDFFFNTLLLLLGNKRERDVLNNYVSCFNIKRKKMHLTCEMKFDSFRFVKCFSMPDRNYEK